jgi:two-component system, NtrC family, sensor kinase
LRRASSRVEEAASVVGPRTILAVDDSATYLAAVCDALRGEGYEVIQARTGEEAIELLSAQSVDCILLDLLMPGMGGQETCRRIKTSPGVRDIPLIMLTAVEDHAAMIEGLSAGADDYVAKSSDTEVLRARVRAQLRRKQFEDENRRIRENLLQHELEATEARAARELAEARAALIVELEFKNRELEAFGSAVSHDLKAPLRSVQGFSQMLAERAADQLDDDSRDYLRRIVAASTRMGELVDDLLELSRLAYGTLNRESIDLGAMATKVLAELGAKEPDRNVWLEIAPELRANADPRLTRILLENLLGNAWKFTRDAPSPLVTFDACSTPRGPAFRVRDNGTGFDATYASKLFVPFQRLHSTAEFPGTGIGLATVKRVVDRHGGAVWAESKVGEGATFYFTLEPAQQTPH